MKDKRLNNELRIIQKIKDSEAYIVRLKVKRATAKKDSDRDVAISKIKDTKNYIKGLQDALYIIQKHTL
tara:strand:+ start:660 stop:866 length:207 start_codon:yes stop_codon:yes gene_type:complete